MLSHLRGLIRPVFGADRTGIQDGLGANQAVEGFGGKAEDVQGLQASGVIHLLEGHGFGFEAATKQDTKKLDLIGEVHVLDQAEAHPFSLFEPVGIKAMLDGIPVAGLSATFTVQGNPLRFDRPDLRLIFGAGSSIALRIASHCISVHFSSP